MKIKIIIVVILFCYMRFSSAAPANKALPVNVDNFVRAETDRYISDLVRGGALGKINHSRELTDIDKQTVIRMNRDTLYSWGVFDLSKSSVTITLPETNNRFMSMQVINQDHYTLEVIYDNQPHQYEMKKVGTRYVAILFRTFVDPYNKEDFKAAHAAQDEIKMKQENAGEFTVPNWDKVTLDKARSALEELASLGEDKKEDYFGRKEVLNPIKHLIGTASGWGGNPKEEAIYEIEFPKQNNGKVFHNLTVKEVPVDGFWSVTVYDEKGFLAKNKLNAYSYNNLTAKANNDKSITIQFGGCNKNVSNCLPITKGWNYTVRLYKPRKEILEAKWKFPKAVPIE